MSDSPRSTDPDSFTHDQYAERVQALLDFDRFDDAQREVHTALGTYPHDGQLLSLAAWVEHCHGTQQEAQRLARAALAVQAEDWRAHIVLTESLIRQGEVAAAAETARRLLSYYPDHAGTHLNCAYVLAHDTRGVGVPEGADHAELITMHLEEALALEPENASHFARASTFMQMRGEFGHARDFIAEALALDPTNSSYITQSASLDEHDRDAFAKLKGALALSPGDTQAAFVLHERAWHLFGYGVLVTLGILTGMVFWFTFLFGISSEDTSHRTLVRLAGVLFIPALFWVIIWVRAFASLPRGI